MQRNHPLWGRGLPRPALTLAHLLPLARSTQLTVRRIGEGGGI